MTTQISNESGVLLVSLVLEDAFDAHAATRLQEAVMPLPRRALVCLDFSHVRRWQDSALALLAALIIGETDRRFVMRGLGLHQRRLLRYLGIDSCPEEPLAGEAS